MNPTKVESRANGKPSTASMMDGADSGFTSHLSDSFNKATEELSSAASDAVATAKAKASGYGHDVSAYVKQNPTTIAFGAAALGFLAGMYIVRRK